MADTGANPKANFAILDTEPELPSRIGCADCGMGRLPRDAEGESTGRMPTTAVRFGYEKYIGEFTYPPELNFTRGARLIIQTKRGIEIGEQVPMTCSGCRQAVSREQVGLWVENCGDRSFIFNAGRILREATAADLAEYAHIQSGAKEKMLLAQQVADRLQLPIKVVECECPFGGERIIFYFTADMRVDFRQMVKELAREFRTRIELRQVGARDEARLLADFETCGQEVCCKTFLKELKKVTMKMAKMQKATLDPTKVSGRCGKLKCCLRYEHATYQELDAELPKLGAQIMTPHGEGAVVARQVLTQLVQVRTEDGTVYTIPKELIGKSPADVAAEQAAAAPPMEEEPLLKAEPRKRPRRPRRRTGTRGEKPDRAKTGELPGDPKRAKPPVSGSSGTRRKDDDGGQGGTSEGNAAADGAARQRKRRPRRRRRRGSGDQPEGQAGS